MGSVNLACLKIVCQQTKISSSSFFAATFPLERHCFILRPAALAALLFLLQAFSGAVTISYYTSVIFENLLSPTGEASLEATSSSSLTDYETADAPPALKSEVGNGASGRVSWLEYGGTLSVGLAYVVGYLTSSVLLLPRVRRRLLLVASALGMAASNAAVAALARFGEGECQKYGTCARTTKKKVNFFLATLGSYVSGIVTAIIFSLFVLSYSSGFGPVPYIFLGELFPPERRGVVTGTVSMAQCVFNFGALKVFPYMLEVPAVFSPVTHGGKHFK